MVLAGLDKHRFLAILNSYDVNFNFNLFPDRIS